MSTKQNKDHWTEGIKSALLQRGNQPNGDGWITFAQLKARMKRGEHFVRDTINSLEEAGKLERFSGTRPRKNGTLATQTWYRITT